MKRILLCGFGLLGLLGCEESVIAFPKDAGGLMCGTGTTQCGERCVSVKEDSSNCGSCGNACSASMACAGAACFATDCTDTDCSSSQVCVSERCRQRDCVGVTCPTDQACYQGACRSRACNGTTCPGEQVCVNGSCLDPDCAGITCSNGRVCEGGVCILRTCTEGTACQPAGNDCHLGITSCDGGTPVCIDSNVNAPNGSVCGDGGVCAAGACGAPCSAGAACAVFGEPCRDGVVQCLASGQASCVQQSIKPAGTLCPGGVCDATGNCLACTAGTVCNPSECTAGLTMCGSGGAQCTSISMVPAGTACDGGVCVGLTCVACSTGSLCTDNPSACRRGTEQCSASGRACVDAMPKDAGTACIASGGGNGVCNGGSCLPCTQGASCTTNPNRCRAGVTECSSGAPVCVDGPTESAGTSCTLVGGGSGVCDGSGVCIACVANSACGTNPNPCAAGTLNCMSGTPTCVDGMSRTVGTSCTTMSIDAGVCNSMATCVACTSGATCTTNPDSCFEGVVSCATGASVCVNGAPKGPGTGCTLSMGGAGVCNGSGSCVACVAGSSCSTNPNVCSQGTLDCSSGTPTCVNGAARSAGSACMTMSVATGVCNGSGTCNACVAASSCTTNPNPCVTGTTQCDTGTAVCANTMTNQPTGTSCGGNNVCVSGTCRACTQHSDCGTRRNCMAGVCEAPRSTCGSLKAAHPSAADGEYFIGGSGLLTYCDMQLPAPLCVEGPYASHTGRMRDGSALPYVMMSRLLSTGVCELYALRHSGNGYPLDSTNGDTCTQMGFRNLVGSDGCQFGYGNPGQDCGYPAAQPATTNAYRYGVRCSGCTLNNGTYASYVLQGLMATAGVMTTFDGSATMRCRTR